MKKLLGTGALLLLIIYLLPVGYRLYAGRALGDGTKDRLAVYAENGTAGAASDALEGGSGLGASAADGAGLAGGSAAGNGFAPGSEGAVTADGFAAGSGSAQAAGYPDIGNPYDNLNNQGSVSQNGTGYVVSGTGTGSRSVWGAFGGSGLANGGSVSVYGAGNGAADSGSVSVYGAGNGAAASGSVSGGGSAGLATGVTGTADQVVTRDVLAEGRITVLVGGEPREMPLETYVEGVVAAEISPDFPEEAIRAQAVAARTYAVYKANAGRPMQHRNADVCDDYRHCAAYIDLASAASGRWGENAAANTNIIQRAVRDTAGEIVTKDGEAIVAVFHAASAARTESAKDIWGTDIPYLQSVVSPGGSACEKYEGTVRLTFDEFRAKALEAYPTADLSGDPRRWFSASTRSDAGSVIVCTLGGVQVRGTDLRTVFGLNSTNFTLTIDENTISFHTIGYGHGVGLSQYGAKYMAGQGSSYRDILTHYYTGTEITKAKV